MKKHIFIAFSLGWTLSTVAQPTFEKYYQQVQWAPSDIAELPSGDLRCGLFGGVAQMTPDGNIMDWRRSSLRGMRRYSDNEFYFVAINHTPPLLYPVIGRMDSLGQVTAMRRYSHIDFQTSYAGLEVTSNKRVITWGREQNFFMSMIDSTFDPILCRQFNHVGGFQFIKELPSGDLLAGINMDTAGAVIARLDPAGNFLWCKSYIRPRGLVSDCLIESDSSFIITGFTDTIMYNTGQWPLDFHPKMFLMKLDGSGNTQWCRGYDSSYLWDIQSMPKIAKSMDNKLVILGTIGTQYASRPFLMKTDLNGDTLWTRTAGVGYYYYSTTNLLVAGNGAIYYNGNVSNFQSSWHFDGAFFFKADPLGNLPCSQAQYTPVVLSDLFPTDSSFTLQPIVDGVVAFDVSSIEVEIDPETYDGCTITSVTLLHPQRPTKVYPNPTPGRFTVEFVDPLMADSYYSVYDTVGKLLLQRPLPAGATLQEVDLSRFGSGTYAIKFTSPENVCYERVVLE